MSQLQLTHSILIEYYSVLLSIDWMHIYTHNQQAKEFKHFLVSNGHCPFSKTHTHTQNNNDKRFLMTTSLVECVYERYITGRIFSSAHITWLVYSMPNTMHSNQIHRPPLSTRLINSSVTEFKLFYRSLI